MHHPGPPRFCSVGSTIELAPRDPDPTESYGWEITQAPAGSERSLGEGAVLDFAPDQPGVYRVTLSAPDGRHSLTVRAFPPVESPEGDTATSGSARHARSGQSGSGIDAPGGSPEGRPRLALSGHVEGEYFVFEAEVQATGRGRDTIDVEIYADDRDPASTDNIEESTQGGRIPLDAVGERSRFHAVAVDDRFSVPDSIAVETTPSVTVDHLTEVPDWATEITLYEVYVRTFTDEGAGFQAIEDRLDYLQSLGIDTLWLTPVLQNDEFDHGYNITDFFSIADDLGTREEFEALIGSAHDRGMNVLFDLVMNHSAREHEFFRRAEQGDPEYRDWYEWEDEAHDEPATYFDWPYIANFNFENLEVRRHLLDVVDEWAPLVDGFRCDMAWAVPTGFWMEIRERVKEEDSSFLLLDETIPYIADFHGRCFDIHFDTTLYHNLREIGESNKEATAVTDAIQNRARTGFPDHAGFLQYLENHDETRYVEEYTTSKTLAAAGATFTLPGIALVYAGQEIGERSRREKIDWEATDQRLHERYKALIETRAEQPALDAESEFEPVQTASNQENVVAYARENDHQRLVVVLNFAAREATVSLPAERVEPTNLVDGQPVGAPHADVSVDDVAVLISNE